MQAGFNLVVSAHALGDKEKMKKSFQKLLEMGIFRGGEDEVGDDEDEDETLQHDGLREELKERQNYVHR